ncbi:hypothetical protein GOBAR_AA00829 [Gossypium barbadense]|uniref:Uncharacterized protein n=2 Tax=Gossypium TaxID=3633 RepID=A0A2P5YVW9_GOSBA|nr:hypothetical protein GOBAR_AA00829 [Gossypium barbadense]
MNRRKRTLKGVRFSTRGSSTGSNTLGSATTDSQSAGDGTLTQSAKQVPATPAVVDANQYGQPIGMEASKLAEFLGTIARTGSICPLNTKHWKHLSKYVLENILRIVHENFDLQGKVEDSDIFSHVGKLQKEFKSTLKTRYYKEMVQEGRSIEAIYENNPPGVLDDQWKWLVDQWGTPQAAAQSEKAKESRTKVRYPHTAGRTGYTTLNAQFAEKEGRELSHLEQFRFQHLRKDETDNFSSDAAEQVYMNAKHVEQIQTIQAEQAVREKTLLEEAKSRFRMEVAEREARLIAEAEERFMKLTEIREAKFMDMFDAREKKYEALINECMAKGMSIEFQSSRHDDKAFSSDDDE